MISIKARCLDLKRNSAILKAVCVESDKVELNLSDILVFVITAEDNEQLDRSVALSRVLNGSPLKFNKATVY